MNQSLTLSWGKGTEKAPASSCWLPFSLKNDRERRKGRMEGRQVLHKRNLEPRSFFGFHWLSLNSVCFTWSWDILIIISSTMTKHLVKAIHEGKGLFGFPPSQHCASLKKAGTGTQTGRGKNLQARTDAKTMEGFCLLVCTPWLVLPTFL